MLELARGLNPARVRLDYEATFREMRDAGYTAVGEFHYVGLSEAKAAVEAARAAGVELVSFWPPTVAGGSSVSARSPRPPTSRRSRSFVPKEHTPGVAPHSVRACTADWLREIGRYAEREKLVRSTSMPTSSPARSRNAWPSMGSDRFSFSPRPVVSGRGRQSCTERMRTTPSSTSWRKRAALCVCPTTEANLGDGFAPVGRIRERGIGLCIGSDSNVRIDPLEELRELEGTARRQELRRNVISPVELSEIGSSEGAGGARTRRMARIEVDLSHVSLRGVDREGVEPALVFGCGADVIL